MLRTSSFCRSASFIRPCRRTIFSSSSSILSLQTSSSSIITEAIKDKSYNSETKVNNYFPLYYNDVYEVPLPKNHRFPMPKYRQVRERLQHRIHQTFEQQQKTPPHTNTANNGEKIGSGVSYEFIVSPLATVEELQSTHCPSYIDRYLKGKDLTPQEIRNVGFPWSPEQVDRSLSSVGGTLAAACSICDRIRQQQGLQQQQQQIMFAAHIAGGTHHSFYDYGEGFSVFNDIAVSANVILKRYADIIPNGILIIDLDVHQGNGSAKLFQNNPKVYTFSMHCAQNIFSKEEKSDLDVALPPECGDQAYLSTLSHWLGVFSKHTEKFDFIFFQAGVDVIKEDRLGKLSLSAGAVQKRNKLVFEFARRTKRPLCISMGGGYPKKDWEPILEAHTNVYHDAYKFLWNSL